MAIEGATFMGFGKRLSELRKGKGWSQQKLASEAGISVSFVHKIESERADPSWSTVVKLARALKCDVGAFDANESPGGEPETGVEDKPLKPKRKPKK